MPEFGSEPKNDALVLRHVYDIVLTTSQSVKQFLPRSRTLQTLANMLKHPPGGSRGAPRAILTISGFWPIWPIWVILDTPKKRCFWTPKVVPGFWALGIGFFGFWRVGEWGKGEIEGVLDGWEVRVEGSGEGGRKRGFWGS